MCRFCLYLHSQLLTRSLRSLHLPCLCTSVPGTVAACSLTACTKGFDHSCLFCVNSRFRLYLWNLYKYQLVSGGLCHWERSLWGKKQERIRPKKEHWGCQDAKPNLKKHFKKLNEVILKLHIYKIVVNTV